MWRWLLYAYMSVNNKCGGWCNEMEYKPMSKSVSFMIMVNEKDFEISKKTDNCKFQECKRKDIVLIEYNWIQWTCKAKEDKNCGSLLKKLRISL